MLLAMFSVCLCETNIYVEQGGSVTLNCTVTGSVIFWVTDSGSTRLFVKGNIQGATDASKYSVVANGAGTSYNMKISDVQPSDDNTYTCFDFAHDEHRVDFKLITIIKPTHLVIFGDEDGFNEFSTSKLTCSVANAKPQPRLAWKQQGHDGYLTRSRVSEAISNSENRTFSASLDLEIAVTKSNIGAVYVCEVTLEGVTAWTMSRTHAIIVNTFPSVPSIKINPEKSIAGGLYSAICETSGARPAPIVTWYLGPASDSTLTELEGSTTSQVASDGTYNTTSILRHTALRQHNLWMLTCTFTNKPVVAASADPRRSRVQLNIQYKPAVESSNGTVMMSEDSELILPCRVDANPPATIRWYHNNVEVNISARGYMFGNNSTPQLTIPSVKHLDEGSWRCEATNKLGTSRGNTSTVDVKHAPVFVMGPTFPVTGVRDGKDVTLTCKVKADPIVLDHLYWFSLLHGKTERIERNTSQNSLRNGNETLTFTKVARNAAGMYFCEAKNSLGTRISSKLELEVQYPPEHIAVTSPDTDYSEGSFMSNITCASNGKPDVTYSWTKDGIPFGSADPVIYFNDSAKADYDGNYVCRVSNYLGSLTKDISINVVYRPQCVLGQKRKYGVSVGGSVVVKCFVRANPRRNTRVVFTYNGKETRLNGIADTSDGTVYYANITHKASTSSDYGQYKCNATNTLGWMREACFIEVVPSSKPDAPTSCVAENATDASFDVACLEGFDGGSTVSYTLQFTADGVYHPVSTSTSARVHMTSQPPGTLYLMRFCASNTEYPSQMSCSTQFNITTTGVSGGIKQWRPATQTSSASCLFPSLLLCVCLLAGCLHLQPF